MQLSYISYSPNEKTKTSATNNEKFTNAKNFKYHLLIYHIPLTNYKNH